MPLRTTRIIAIAASAAFLATSADLRMAAAGPASPSKSPGQELSAAGTDFSARKRKRVRRGGGNAAAVAAIIGTIGAIAATQAHRKRYRHYGYHGGPVYYGAPGYYYGAPNYYYRAPRNHYGAYGYRYYGSGNHRVLPPAAPYYFSTSPGHL